MKIATWNVNSIKARLEPALAWLKQANPDVVALQEIKTVDENFPKLAFEALGYNCAVHGQKSYNGVALLSKRPMEDVTPRLHGDEADDHARYLEAVVSGDKGTVRLATIYAPNGNPWPGPKFDYKLAWLERLRLHARKLLKNEEPVVLMGDYNIIPQDKDAAKPKNWVKDALFQPESKAALRRIENLGYTDAFRALHSEGGHYTFWDYFGSWERNNGIRIDHLLLSPQALDRLTDVGIDKDVRGASEKPSDHVPAWIKLAI
ncbi:MAG TPA: exodeoxyribonuclease III [Rhizomicrobium sp.]|jgi:exodeoxyribonuclease-3|nr:exodeoxyribonuclease III [Rhizomicrobium sp.]